MVSTILVVDDSTSIRNMLKAFLMEFGLTVLEAGGGRAGLEQLRHNAVDLVITDQNMPGLDGVGFVKALRESGNSMPVLVLTTETSDEMKAKFRTAGANAWMSKPFTPERLEAALAKLLHLR